MSPADTAEVVRLLKAIDSGVTWACIWLFFALFK